MLWLYPLRIGTLLHAAIVLLSLVTEIVFEASIFCCSNDVLDLSLKPPFCHIE